MFILRIESKPEAHITMNVADTNAMQNPMAQDTVVQSGQISFSSELVRKSIHLCSLSIPIGYAYVSRETALWVIVPILAFSLLFDIGRHYFKSLRWVVNTVFKSILRPHEREGQKILLSGATYVLLSAVICIVIFPKLITITAFAILIVSDASSAILGRKFGKHRFFDKSLEGSIAFAISAFIVVLITPKAAGFGVEYLIGTIAGIVGAMFEAASVTLHFDDNLSVPLSIGATMWLLYYLVPHFAPAYSGLYHLMMTVA